MSGPDGQGRVHRKPGLTWRFASWLASGTLYVIVGVLYALAIALGIGMVLLGWVTLVDWMRR